MTGRFLVVNGDAIDFNTVYRDGNLTWPVQDLPFQLVFFCHRNPVYEEAFQPDVRADDAAPPDPQGKTSTGTPRERSSCSPERRSGSRVSWPKRTPAFHCRPSRCRREFVQR